MSALTWPSGLQVGSFAMKLNTVQRAHSSPFSGSEQVVDLLNDRWLISLELAPSNEADGGAQEALINSLRGMTNTVALWHMSRPEPKGTMRGAPTLSGDHAQGASALNVATGQAGCTVAAGDVLGVGGLLVMAASAATADGLGAITIPIVNRLRALVSNGSSVTWDKPTAPFRMATKAPAPTNMNGIASTVSLDFVEAVS